MIFWFLRLIYLITLTVFMFVTVIRLIISIKNKNKKYIRYIAFCTLSALLFAASFCNFTLKPKYKEKNIESVFESINIDDGTYQFESKKICGWIYVCTGDPFEDGLEIEDNYVIGKCGSVNYAFSPIQTYKYEQPYLLGLPENTDQSCLIYDGKRYIYIDYCYCYKNPAIIINFICSPAVLYRPKFDLLDVINSTDTAHPYDFSYDNLLRNDEIQRIPEP